jgi:hypothetical protein
MPNKRMIIIGILAQILFILNGCTGVSPNDPTPSVWFGGVPPKNAAAVISNNRARWQAAQITDYRYQLTINCFCFPTRDILPLTIDVRAGHLAGITTNDGTPYPTNDPMYAFVQDYATIDAMFATLMRDEMQQADVLDINYDQTYGFPVDIAVTYEQGRLDDGMTVSVREFTPLP